MDRWKTEPVERLIQRSLTYAKNNDQESFDTAMMALAYALKHTEDLTCAQKVAAVVTDSQKSLVVRTQFLRQLVLAGTSQTLDQILSTYHDSRETAIKEAIVKGLPELQGDYRVSHEREDLSPRLIAAFGEEPNDSPLFSPIARLLAAFGSKTGVSFLIGQVLAENPTIQQIEESSDPRLSASMDALRQIYRQDAVPVLAPLLVGYDYSNPRIHLAGQVLARIPDQTATQLVIDYAISAPAEFAPAIAMWVRKGNAELAFVAAQISANEFSSPEVKQALLQVIEQMKPQVSGKR
ncbi:MAG: hypothetical protein ABL962_09585 [Fimbriimonadaceae bacterium]